MEGQQENSSQQFKSTDIYASKASKKADYFGHVKPTLQDKVRTKAKNLHQQPRRRKLIIAILCVLILIMIIIGVGFWLLVAQPFNNQSSDSADPDSAGSTPIVVTPEDDVDTINSAYQDKIKSTTDSSELAALYIERANDLIARYIEEGDQEALEAALSDTEAAEDLDPSFDSAEELARIYQYLGDNDKAAEYTQLAEQRRSPIQLNERGEPIDAQ